MRANENGVIPAFEKLITSRIVLTMNDRTTKNKMKLNRTEYRDLWFMISEIFHKANQQI